MTIQEERHQADSDSSGPNDFLPSLPELLDGWWMRNTDRTAHRLLGQRPISLGEPLSSACGLRDRMWRQVAAAGLFCCKVCSVEAD
jgi:hypothetical protein